MKRQIRLGIFESNSSSTHTICICSEEEFDKWKKGELIYDDYYEKFVPVKQMTDEEIDQALKEYYDYNIKGDFCKEYKDLTESEKRMIKEKVDKFNGTKQYGTTYEEWLYSSNLETYAKHYTSEHGDKIVIFGEYGYDG